MQPGSLSIITRVHLVEPKFWRANIRTARDLPPIEPVFREASAAVYLAIRWTVDPILSSTQIPKLGDRYTVASNTNFTPSVESL